MSSSSLTQLRDAVVTTVVDVVGSVVSPARTPDHDSFRAGSPSSAVEQQSQSSVASARKFGLGFGVEADAKWPPGENVPCDKDPYCDPYGYKAMEDELKQLLAENTNMCLAITMVRVS